MSGLFWLSDRQFSRMHPYFPLAHGVPRSDDLRVISGIIHVIRNSLRWRDASDDFGPHKTLYNRFVRWSKLGVFDPVISDLAAENDKAGTFQIDAIYLKAYRTACSLAKKGIYRASLAVQKVA